MTDISDWFKSLPVFTRYWLGLTTLFSLLGRFGIIKPMTLILSYEPLMKFQIWRPVTALFYYPISPATGFHFLINCYFLYNYSLRLETGVFAGRPADYFFMLIFDWICCVIIALLVEVPILMDPMVMSVLYVWCQLNKDTIVSFWFGTQFKAMYLPWVLFLFNLIISGGGYMELVGILVGHLYFFLMFKYPQELGGPHLLSTPSLLKYYFPETRGGVYGFGGPQPNGVQQQQNRRNQPMGGGFLRGHNWGRGQPLGDN